jgi:hypothetical protein
MGQQWVSHGSKARILCGHLLVPTSFRSLLGPLTQIRRVVRRQHSEVRRGAREGLRVGRLLVVSPVGHSLPQFSASATPLGARPHRCAKLERTISSSHEWQPQTPIIDLPSTCWLGYKCASRQVEGQCFEGGFFVHVPPGDDAGADYLVAESGEAVGGVGVQGQLEELVGYAASAFPSVDVADGRKDRATVRA